MISRTLYMLTRNDLECDYRVLHSQNQPEGVEVRFRHSKAGPEEELVEKFLRKTNIKIPSGLRLTFFKEPWLDSGAPDIVGVIWDPTVASEWNRSRKSLGKIELRLIHFLNQSGPCSLQDLQASFQRKVSDAIDKLEAVGMVYRNGDIITPKSMSKIYATRHIFAIEAKIGVWKQAVYQAFRNRWFATASYILLPHIPNSSKLRVEANKLNIGILHGEEESLDFRPLVTGRSPESYCSWLFNEWTWRADPTIHNYVERSPSVDTRTVSRPA